MDSTRRRAVPQLILISIFCFLMFSCSTRVLAPREHVVLIDKSGRALNPETQSKELHPTHPAQQNVAETLPYDLTAHFNDILTGMEEFRRSQDDTSTLKLLFFVHGGLNMQITSLNRANEHYELIKEAGYYPVFINWHSNLLVSLWERFISIRQGRETNPVLVPFQLSFLAF